MRRSHVLATCLFLFCPLAVTAMQEDQPPLRISLGVAEQNITFRVNPSYPEAAKPARIQGKVVLSVLVSGEGKVDSIKVISGHPLFIQPAIDAVKQWEYRPFLLNGKPCRVSTTVEVPFSLLTPEETAKFAAEAHEFYVQEEQCRTLIASRAYVAAEASCGSLPALAEKLDPNLIQERIHAYRDIDSAYFMESRFQDARDAALSELRIARWRLEHNDPEMARIDMDVARGFQTTADSQQAKSYYEQATKIFEQAVQSAGDSVNKAQLRTELLKALRDYALLLRQMGNLEEANVVQKKGEALAAESTRE